MLTYPVVVVRKRTIPTERPPLVGEVSVNSADRGCHVLSMTDPYGRILRFIDRQDYNAIFLIYLCVYSLGREEETEKIPSVLGACVHQSYIA
jgi:hypothetical protein